MPVLEEEEEKKVQVETVQPTRADDEPPPIAPVRTNPNAPDEVSLDSDAPPAPKPATPEVTQEELEELRRKANSETVIMPAVSSDTTEIPVPPTINQPETSTVAPPETSTTTPPPEAPAQDAGGQEAEGSQSWKEGGLMKRAANYAALPVVYPATGAMYGVGKAYEFVTPAVNVASNAISGAMNWIGSAMETVGNKMGWDSWKEGGEALQTASKAMDERTETRADRISELNESTKSFLKNPDTVETVREGEPPQGSSMMRIMMGVGAVAAAVVAAPILPAVAGAAMVATGMLVASDALVEATTGQGLRELVGEAIGEFKEQRQEAANERAEVAARRERNQELAVEREQQVGRDLQAMANDPSIPTPQKPEEFLAQLSNQESPTQIRGNLNPQFDFSSNPDIRQDVASVGLGSDGVAGGSRSGSEPVKATAGVGSKPVVEGREGPG